MLLVLGGGGRRAETEARRRGLEPCQGKLREKGCHGKPHPPECLQALGHSRARGTSGNVRQNASFHLLLWKDTYTGLLQAWESQDSSHPWGGRSRELFTPCLTGHRHQPWTAAHKDRFRRTINDLNRGSPPMAAAVVLVPGTAATKQTLVV